MTGKKHVYDFKAPFLYSVTTQSNKILTDVLTHVLSSGRPSLSTCRVQATMLGVRRERQGATQTLLPRASRCKALREETVIEASDIQTALLVVNVLLSEKQTVREHRLRTQNWSEAEKREVVDGLHSESEEVVQALQRLRGFRMAGDWFKEIIFYYFRKMYLLF